MRKLDQMYERIVQTVDAAVVSKKDFYVPFLKTNTIILKYPVSQTVLEPSSSTQFWTKVAMYSLLVAAGLAVGYTLACYFYYSPYTVLLMKRITGIVNETPDYITNIAKRVVTSTEQVIDYQIQLSYSYQFIIEASERLASNPNVRLQLDVAKQAVNIIEITKKLKPLLVSLNQDYQLLGYNYIELQYKIIEVAHKVAWQAYMDYSILGMIFKNPPSV